MPSKSDLPTSLTSYNNILWRVLHPRNVDTTNLPMDAPSNHPTEHPLNSLYSPLQDSDEIRVLHLRSRSSSDNIISTLKHVKFSEDPTYEALSYVWGSPEVTKVINLDGVELPVRENLYCALDHLRLENKTRILWIDALCINQIDEKERNHQVAQMGTIYQSAERVVAWLGDSDDSSSSAFRAILDTKEWYVIKEESQNRLNRGSKISLQTAFFQCVLDLFSRPYWTRMWIIQEVLLARKLLFQCGDDNCSWRQLIWFLNFFGLIDESYPNYNANVGYSHYRPQNLLALRERDIFSKDVADHLSPTRDCTTSGEWSFSPCRPESHVSDRWSYLVELMLLFERAECQNTLDKAFSLYALAADCCRKALPIDYSLSPKELYGIVLRHYKEYHRNSYGQLGSVGQMKLRTLLGSEFTDLEETLQDMPMSSSRYRYAGPSEQGSRFYSGRAGVGDSDLPEKDCCLM
jgi:hypothetical protein